MKFKINQTNELIQNGTKVGLYGINDIKEDIQKMLISENASEISPLGEAFDNGYDTIVNGLVPYFIDKFERK